MAAAVVRQRRGWTPGISFPPESEWRKRLEQSFLTDELLDLIQLGGQEVCEVLVAVDCDHDHILVADVELLFRYAELGSIEKTCPGLRSPRP